jgi:hypothetical protein
MTAWMSQRKRPLVSNFSMIFHYQTPTTGVMGIGLKANFPNRGRLISFFLIYQSQSHSICSK